MTGISIIYFLRLFLSDLLVFEIGPFLPTTAFLLESKVRLKPRRSIALHSCPHSGQIHRLPS